MIMAILLGLGLAGVASYSIVRPLRRVQGQIRRIGQGNFGPSVHVPVPQELGELVNTLNWMEEKLQQLDQIIYKICKFYVNFPMDTMNRRFSMIIA